MKFYFEKRVITGFVVALSILIGLGIYSFLNNQKLVAIGRLVSHTNEVLYHAEHVLTTIIDLETSQRGYVITGNEAFLTPYQVASDTIKDHLHRLQVLTQDNARQRVRLTKLSHLVDEELTYTSRVIQARAVNFETAYAIIASLEGKRISDAIRTLLNDFRNEESQLLQERQRQRDKSAYDFNFAFVLLIGVIFLVLLAVFFTINLNLKKRTEAERELKRTSKEVHDLYNQAPIGYHSLDNEGLFVDANKTLLSWLQYRHEELVGKPFLEFVNADGADLFQRHFPVFKSQGYIENLEFDLIRKDGTSFPVILNASAVTDDQGDYIKSRSTLFNNTERKLAESRTIQLNKELEAFTYSVSHDLRAPLRSVNGYARILQEDYQDKLDDEGKRLVKTIIRNAAMMGQLIDDLLDFSRVGRKELSKVTVDTNNLVHSVVHDMTVNNTRITIHKLDPVLADLNMLRQVWINLISNAVKYSSKSESPAVTISSSVLTSKHEVVYSIQDNGVGFDMKYAHKLFGVFQRLHKSDDFEGTGVGLALAHRIITRHGGRAWAEAKVNEGATFYFSLPFTQD